MEQLWGGGSREWQGEAEAALWSVVDLAVGLPV